MTIVSVCMSYNEEIMVESFVRYAFTFSDYVIVYNHNSTDNTETILRKLQNEFSNRLILYKYSVGFFKEQSRVVNSMMNYAFNELDADLVLPLDTDEFPISLDKNKSIKDILSSLPSDVINITRWIPFSLGDGSVDINKFLPYSFKYMRISKIYEQKKSIISRENYFDYKLVLEEGNHGAISLLGIKPQEKEVEELAYAHFPYRSIDHYIIKVINGWYKRYLNPEWGIGVSEHYKAEVDKIMSGLKITPEYLNYISICYNGLTGEDEKKLNDLIKEVDTEKLFGKIDIKFNELYKDNKSVLYKLINITNMISENYKKDQLKFIEKNKEAEMLLFNINEANKKANNFQKEIEDLKNNNKNFETENKNIKKQIEKTEQEKYKLESTLITKEAKIRELKTEIDNNINKHKALNDQFNEISRKNVELQENLANINEENKRILYELAQMKNSHSWRITAPIRKLFRILRKTLGIEQSQ